MLIKYALCQHSLFKFNNKKAVYHTSQHMKWALLHFSTLCLHTSLLWFYLCGEFVPKPEMFALFEWEGKKNDEDEKKPKWMVDECNANNRRESDRWNYNHLNMKDCFTNENNAIRSVWGCAFGYDSMVKWMPQAKSARTRDKKRGRRINKRRANKLKSEHLNSKWNAANTVWMELQRWKKRG